MSSNAFTKENTVPILIRSVRLGQKMGAYSTQECSTLYKAFKFFNPEVEAKDKPDFDGTPNPEIFAISLLLQAVQKAQAHGGDHAYTIEDASLLWDITEYWIKEGGKQVAENVIVDEPSKSSKRKSNGKGKSKQTVDSDDETGSDTEGQTESPLLVDPRVTKKNK